MNNIRKNNEEEEILLKLSFKMPTLIKVIYGIFIVIFSGLYLVGAVVPIIILCLHIKKMKTWSCQITNKRIYGTTGFIMSSSYSHRLDMIDDVSITEFIGVKSLKLTFSQGKTTNTIPNGNFFFISWIENITEAYEKVVELLNGVKNEIDLQTDIEMKKIETEEKKADAFIKIADNLAVANPSTKKEENDYLSQLEKLYSLKEKGIITEEEFIQKKKELL